jgi:GNAT superfamily N-acetyltransferase
VQHQKKRVEDPALLEYREIGNIDVFHAAGRIQQSAKRIKSLPECVKIEIVIDLDDAVNSDLFIRPIEPRDAADVCVLIQQLGYDRAQDQLAIWIESLPKRADQQSAFVACLADEVVGWIEISIEHRLQSPPCTLIGGLVVKERLRGRQIGLMLCERAEAWSWEHGISTVRVTSRSTRTDAHRFYLRNGYHLTKVSQVFEKTQPK